MARARKSSSTKKARNPNDWPETYKRETVRCGRPSCRCASGLAENQHGPYWYAYWTEPSGKTKKRYLGKSFDPTARARREEQRRERAWRAEAPPMWPLLEPMRAPPPRVELVRAEDDEPREALLLSPLPPTGTRSRAVALGAGSLYQLKVRLLGVTPTVWRRFCVPGSTKLSRLHTTLQIVMGWEDFHLHQFHIDGEVYGSFELSGAGSEHATLDELALPVHATFLYEYDMGDLWQHDVRIEKISRPSAKFAYPRCLAGKEAAPPEDSGGPMGYRRRRGSRQRDTFDVDAVNRELERCFRERETPSPPLGKEASLSLQDPASE